MAGADIKVRWQVHPVAQGAPAAAIPRIWVHSSNVCLPQTAGRTGVEGPGLSRAQRLLFGLGFVMLPYLWGRLSRAATQMEWNARVGLGLGASSRTWGRKAWAALQGLETVYKVSSAANLCAFLSNGRYRCV